VQMLQPYSVCRRRWCVQPAVLVSKARTAQTWSRSSVVRVSAQTRAVTWVTTPRTAAWSSPSRRRGAARSSSIAGRRPGRWT